MRFDAEKECRSFFSVCVGRGHLRSGKICDLCDSQVPSGCGQRTGSFPPDKGYGRLGCVLLCFFLAAAFARAHRFAVQGYLHLKGLGVVGAALAHKPVTEHLAALFLHQLLKGRFVVP